MVLSLIVYSALDVTSTAVWWVVKNTSVGIYNGISYMVYGYDEDITIKTSDLKALTYEVQKLNEEVKILREKDKDRVKESKEDKEKDNLNKLTLLPSTENKMQLIKFTGNP